MKANVATAIVLGGAAAICLGGTAAEWSNGAIIAALLGLVALCFALDRWVMG